MAASTPRVELGFVEKPDDSSPLTSPFFPNKVGGKPAWLDLQNLPPPEQLACDICQKPCVLLLQVYAPLDDNPKAFHRSVFLFMCRDSSCHRHQGTKAFKVLRSQLPKVNSFYSSIAPDREDSESEAEEELACAEDSTKAGDKLKVKHAKCASDVTSDVPSSQPCETSNPGVSSSARVNNGSYDVSTTEEPPVALGAPPMCIVCGCLGPKRCGRCQQVNYCSKEHQVHDWKSGHKLICSDLAAKKMTSSGHDMQYVPSTGVLLLEYEIMTEPEPMGSESRAERSEEERMEDYLKFVKSSKYKEIGKGEVKTEKTLETAKSDVTSDKYFRAFKRRIAVEPEQILRYERGGQPLLVSGENVPRPQDLPKCSCGAARIFEFQALLKPLLDRQKESLLRYIRTGIEAKYNELNKQRSNIEAKYMYLYSSEMKAEVMPQLLYYLKLDSVSGQSIDWGTLLVYCCAGSCDSARGYCEEFLWKQDFSQHRNKKTC